MADYLMTTHDLANIAKLAGLVLSLGLDTFAVAIGLGLSGVGRRDRIRYGVSFALAEGIMPLVGFLVGQVVANVVSAVASYVAIALLLGVGLYILWESMHEEEREFEAATVPRLLTLALSVSMDELAVGFSLGLLRIPVLVAAALIAAQAFLLTWIGISFGKALGEVLAERAELLSGIVLSLLALLLLVLKVMGIE